MALPQISREQLLAAMQRFDQEARHLNEWSGWQNNGNYEYAVEHENKLYPPKEIISLAAGVSKDSFNGGYQSNKYLQNYGFIIKRLRSSAKNSLTGLRDALQAILQYYIPARKSGPFSKTATIVEKFRRAEQALLASDPVRSRPYIKVHYSVGQGKWAEVPWISLLAQHETKTTQSGRYVVFLFRADCSGVYLTFNQGVTNPTKTLGRSAGLQQLRERAEEMRVQIPELAKTGFALDNNIVLNRDGLGADYVASTVAHKLYLVDDIPEDAELEADLEAVLAAYGKVLAGSATSITSQRAWIFQANPKYYDISAAVRALPEMLFTVNQHMDEVRAGDTVFLWESGPDAGIVAISQVAEPPSRRENTLEDDRFAKAPEQFAGAKPRALLRVTQVLPQKLSKSRLIRNPAFADLTFLKAPMGTNFPLTKAHHEALKAMLTQSPTPPTLTVGELCASFSSALTKAGLSFGSSHDYTVRCFFASVLAKPFVILTGLSGSGKTQLALKLGEWLGDDHYRVIPVRPDWTGPESLLGYEDALLPVSAGQRAWCVPDALQLMLQAINDPKHLYLLILDEMNLAHVERYFADVLSGIESREAVLPNLARDKDGHWRVPSGEPAKKQIPRNLIIVGTVNVDETTYIFSPKVLDRANTIEFRVLTDALPKDPNKVVRPGRCTAATPDELSSLLRIILDDKLQTNYAKRALSQFADTVRQIHHGLSLYNLEFGHRTYYESLRLAAFLLECGAGTADESIDVFLLQKILPRIHGARRKLEPLLRSLGAFAFDKRPMSIATDFDVLSVDAASAELSRTFAKVSRMMRVLHANQFVSFSD